MVSDHSHRFGAFDSIVRFHLKFFLSTMSHHRSARSKKQAKTGRSPKQKTAIPPKSSDRQIYHQIDHTMPYLRPIRPDSVFHIVPNCIFDDNSKPPNCARGPGNRSSRNRTSARQPNPSDPFVRNPTKIGLTTNRNGASPGKSASMKNYTISRHSPIKTPEHHMKLDSNTPVQGANRWARSKPRKKIRTPKKNSGQAKRLAPNRSILPSESDQ